MTQEADWMTEARASISRKGPTRAPTKPTKPSSVSFGSADPEAVSSKEPDWGYGPKEIAEFWKLLKDLGDLEEWSDAERLEIEDEFQRMSPARFPAALAALRTACKDALKPWPEAPKTRATLRFCALTKRRTAEEIRRELGVIEGGKKASSERAKRPTSSKEAA